MKHRTHNDFPSYRVHSYESTNNKTTNHFIRIAYDLLMLRSKNVKPFTCQNTLLKFYSLTYNMA